MTEAEEEYFCEICGAEVKVTKGGAGTLVCCDQPMALKS